jgi:hypothetical protein
MPERKPLCRLLGEGQEPDEVQQARGIAQRSRFLDPFASHAHAG